MCASCFAAESASLRSNLEAVGAERAALVREMAEVEAARAAALAEARDKADKAQLLESQVTTIPHTSCSSYHACMSVLVLH